MNTQHVASLARELQLTPRQVEAAAALLEEGATVPFIARYRKEATGSLDEVQITSVRDRLEQMAEVDKRREAILKSLAERDLLTDELSAKLADAQSVVQLEDIYLPFRPKRRTRAIIAREKGLEPLAEWLLAQGPGGPETEAAKYVDAEEGVENAEDAVAGARDILAEMASEDQAAREELRALFQAQGTIASKVAPKKETEGAKFSDYFDWSEPVRSVPSHRILAMLRGERETVLRLRVEPDAERAVAVLTRRFVKNATPAGQQVVLAMEDSYKRLLAPSIEGETRLELKRRADVEAIRVFAENLRELLMAPPLGRRRVMGLDPGFRTGCKLVCLDAQGKLLHHDTIYPHTGGAKAEEAGCIVTRLVAKYDIEAIAVGNGTAGRETERFLADLGLPASVAVIAVNESGASVYSASEVAREEFPDHDVTVRGSVSIARRLTDPLAELVKIDPKAIGVGQYQHDVNQVALKRSLDDVVSSCVNAVGVDVNTASKQLLTYVSGLGPVLAANIVAHRDEHGAFASRKALLKVARLGPKAFEQAAGFLRVNGGDNPLDASAVHPESYAVVDAMAADLGCAAPDLLRDAALRAQIDPKRYVTETVGLPTLKDILAELAKPGRDPRKSFEVFRFADGVEKLEDLAEGMVVPGIVTNVTAFGAFVDVGVHQDGLVHISQLADRFVRDPAEVVKVAQRVQVRVLSVDLPRKRIALSMKNLG